MGCRRPESGYMRCEIRSIFGGCGIPVVCRILKFQQRGVCVGKGRVYADLNRVVE